MSRKTELLNQLQTFKTAYETLEENVREKRESGLYSGIGLEQETNRLLSEISVSVQNMHDRMIETVVRGLERLEEKWKAATTGRLADAGYQSGLANAVKMLELEALTDQKDVDNLIAAYQGDYNAMAVIKRILLNCQNEELRASALKIPKDRREETRERLAKLQERIRECVNIHAVEEGAKGQLSGFTSLSFSLDGLINFVRDRLGDELEVQDWAQS